MKNQPATQLPWNQQLGTQKQGATISLDGSPLVLVYGETRTEAVKDAEYIAHAANAYPKLIEALKAAYVALDRCQTALGTEGALVKRVDEVRFDSGALLNELGEM
jgi:hypothetical protein